MPIYYLYIIYSVTLDKYYTGHTIDPNKRLMEHNTGKSTFTASASDWILRYTEQFNTRELAKARELQIKKKKSRKYIEWLISSAG
jgi:putative endonuclease